MKKILTILTTIAFITSGFVAKAQNAVNGKVDGVVMSSQKSIESASIGILRAKDSSVVKMGVSDKTGQFEFENIKEGKYIVAIQAIGHSKYYSELFEITNKTTNYTLKKIDLLVASKSLGNVTVTSSKPMIEQKLDRTIVNVEASITNVGISALDVLEKSPGVSVDKDGNISLKGKQGVQIFVDGRPTYLSGQDLANMLRNMQSSQLDQLEIMTNPPAKYEAAGNSGIINIKTKKNKQVGYNGSVTVGYGQGVYPKTNESVNMNYRNNKINLFGTASYAHRERFQNLQIQRKFIDATSKDVVSNFAQENNLKNNDESFNGKIGMDYFATKKTTIGIVLNNGKSFNDFSSRGMIDISNPTNLLLSQTRAASDNENVWKNFSTNLNLRHILDTTGSEITADFDYFKYKSTNQQFVSNAYFAANGAPLPNAKPDTLTGNLPQDINIYSVKVDYVKPLKGGARFEAGFKSSIVRTDNNASYDSLINNNLVHDFNRSNHFIYEENINAAYVNYSRPFSKKFSGQFGVRMEHTRSSGNQVTSQIEFNRNYVQLFPTAYLQYQLNPKHVLVLNYGKRINRPDYEDLNPFVTFLDRYTYEQGNPNLQPQFSHNIELTHTFNNFLTTTANFTKTTDIIQDVLEQNTNSNESYIKKTNIANQRQYGLSVNANFPIAKWWTNNIYVNVFNNEFNGIVNGEMIMVGATTGMINIQEQFKFSKGWSGEVSGFGRTQAQEGIFTIGAFGSINLGISKQMLKNKGNLKLSVRDVLWSQRISGFSKYSNIDAKFQQYGESRVINLSFTYRFSKGKINNTQRKRGGASEEASRVKSGDNQ